MRRIAVVGLMGVALVFAGCSDNSGSEQAAEEAAAAAEATQEQLTELQEQVQDQAQDLKQQEQQAAQQAKAAARKAARKARQQANAEAAAAAEPPEPPDVVGLTLTTAQQELRASGYRVDATNTDTAFGIIDTDNYTVCTQDPPRGSVVPVLAQKYGC